MTEDENMYEMTLSLNVLRHLGINLYSSNPAVLSEAVANAWDADAPEVRITLDRTSKRIIVQDTGSGMTLSDVNARFLKIGYERRNEPSGAVTPSNRPVMGRKGIGKLALFSIARTILIETSKDGQLSALEMDLGAIEDLIRNDDPSKARTYNPKEMPTDGIDFAHGTRITLTNLTKGLDQTGSHLRKRLARRFSVIGQSHNFRVYIDDEEVTAADRDLAPTVQYIWAYGDDAAATLDSAAKAEHKDRRPSDVAGQTVDGWIGTVASSAELTDPATGESANKLPLMIRGKMAAENLLEFVSEVGVYQNYLVGEIHADYLDDDKGEDIATSSRQSVREDDPRFRALIEFVSKEIKFIKSKWTDLRNEGGRTKALEIPEIREWYLTIGADAKKKAERLFGKINQLGLEPKDEAELFAQGILAFEIMKQRDQLDALEGMDPSDFATVAKILNDASQLEAVMYHQIVKSRLRVIDKMSELVSSVERERFLQEHLFDHLWLLDPGWERAVMPSMEASMKTVFADIAKKLKKGEANSRWDIKYQRTSGLHVIVELKKADVVTSTTKLIEQVSKYRNALLTWLANANRRGEPVAIVCVVGRELSDWSNIDGRTTSAASLKPYDTRVLLYDELIMTARAAYDDYLAKTDEISRVQKILDAVSERAATTI